MSPRGEFLVVSKLDEPGVFIWSNRSLYAHVSLKGNLVYLAPTPRFNHTFFVDI